MESRAEGGRAKRGGLFRLVQRSPWSTGPLSRGRLSPPLPQQHTTYGHTAWTADGFPPTAALAMPHAPTHVYAMRGGRISRMFLITWEHGET